MCYSPACWDQCRNMPCCSNCRPACCAPVIAVNPAGAPLTPAGTVHWQMDAIWVVPREYTCAPCECKKKRCPARLPGTLTDMSHTSGLRPERLTDLLLGALPCETQTRCQQYNEKGKCDIPFICDRGNAEFRCKQYLKWREAMLKRMGTEPTVSECKLMLAKPNDYGGETPPKTKRCSCCLDEGDDDIDSDLHGKIKLRETTSLIRYRQLQQQYLSRYHRRLSKSADPTRNKGWQM